jgi:hypothetical protein
MKEKMIIEKMVNTIEQIRLATSYKPRGYTDIGR